MMTIIIVVAQMNIDMTNDKIIIVIIVLKIKNTVISPTSP